MTGSSSRRPRRQRGARRTVLRLARPELPPWLELSVRLDRRGLIALGGCALAAVIAVGVTLSVGQYFVPPGEVWAALTGHASGADQLIVTTLRLPRVLVALFAGSALGMSGAVFQGITLNPLVAPDIIGVNSGAAAAVVGAVVIGKSGQPPALFALGGALAAAAAVYLVSARSGLPRFRVVLVGIGVNATLGAVITYLLTQANLTQAAELSQYLLGDVSGSTWSTVRDLVPASVVLLAAGTLLGRRLEILQLGDSVATGLGARPGRDRLLLLGTGTGLAAVAVAAAGPVGFVAFIAPHIARRLTRAAGASVLPLSAAVGGVVTVVADYAAQRILEPTQLPVGIATVIIAGPYFAVLLFRAARAGTIG